MDREGAELASAATERAHLRAQEGARNLASLLGRTARTLERSASLAEEHARRSARDGEWGVARDEQRAARKAREASERAQAQAERALELSNGRHL